MDYNKGWFCPLLFASGRTPNIPQAKDFSMAEFDGPGLSADTELTRSLVELLSQDLPIDGLCPTDPKGCNAPI
ncbi:hypothetical protein GJ744_005196 [Endocarpon pusillum]|uniref:Uncharacterized protein n=1 Tax=Endocarpon pusillum TaxID=364733 RepID=A0A8H7A7V2_9EURO|nr:hypothetical protein GJ744_005196 [Endocarpon pusillum]